MQVKKEKTLSNTMVKTYIKQSQSGNREAKDILVERNVRLVWSVVQRFINRGYDPDDLFQIGCIGLIKAIDKFDLSYDVLFSTYAVPMIIGEIKRFIRDDGSIKVSRSLKEIANKTRRKKEELTKEYGRAPSLNEIANELELKPEEIIQAEESVKNLHSIHETIFKSEGEPIYLIDQLADEKSNWFEKISLKDVIQQLNKRERIIIYLRYYKDKTQSEVARRLGISQVQVSRLEKQILKELKRSINTE